MHFFHFLFFFCFITQFDLFITHKNTFFLTEIFTEHVKTFLFFYNYQIVPLKKKKENEKGGKQKYTFKTGGVNARLKQVAL